MLRAIFQNRCSCRGTPAYLSGLPWLKRESQQLDIQMIDTCHLLNSVVNQLCGELTSISFKFYFENSFAMVNMRFSELPDLK